MSGQEVSLPVSAAESETKSATTTTTIEGKNREESHDDCTNQQQQKQHAAASGRSGEEKNNDDEDDGGRFLIRVGEDIPSLQECYDYVSGDPACGAVSTFAGITRDNFRGKIVKKLSYEGYVPMAIKELRKICSECADKFFPSVSKIAAVHILGDCPVGNASVILAASSPHRRESIRCVEFLIDELKAKVPIWKLEVYEDDDSVWKENIEWHDGKHRRVMVEQ